MAGYSEPDGGEGGGQRLCGHLQPRGAGGKDRLPASLADQDAMVRPGLTPQGGIKNLVSRKPDAV